MCAHRGLEVNEIRFFSLSQTIDLTGDTEDGINTADQSSKRDLGRGHYESRQLSLRLPWEQTIVDLDERRACVSPGAALGAAPSAADSRASPPPSHADASPPPLALSTLPAPQPTFSFAPVVNAPGEGLAEQRDAPDSRATGLSVPALSAAAPSVPAPSAAEPSTPSPSVADLAEAALATMNAKEALDMLAETADSTDGAAAPMSATGAARDDADDCADVCATPLGEDAAVMGDEAAAAPAKDTLVAAPVAAAPATETTTAPPAFETGATHASAAETATGASLPALAVVGQRVQIVYSGAGFTAKEHSCRVRHEPRH